MRLQAAPGYYIRPFQQSDAQQVRDLFVETHNHAMAALSQTCNNWCASPWPEKSGAS